jgi:hypothetical protein
MNTGSCCDAGFAHSAFAAEKKDSHAAFRMPDQESEREVSRLVSKIASLSPERELKN